MRNVVPRQGTESNLAVIMKRAWELVLRNVVPRQGTERVANIAVWKTTILLRNVVPRQGTESLFSTFLSETIAD